MTDQALTKETKLPCVWREGCSHRDLCMQAGCCQGVVRNRELPPPNPVDDHDCLLRAADMFERTAENVRVIASGDEAHQALWDSLRTDSLRLRTMAEKLSRTITQQQWHDNAIGKTS